MLKKFISYNLLFLTQNQLTGLLTIDKNSYYACKQLLK